jgi:hypothetical protein
MNMMIPHGEEMVTVELTLKEAMALSGYRFNQNAKQLAFARRKVKKALDRKIIGENEQPIRYEELTH